MCQQTALTAQEPKVESRQICSKARHQSQGDPMRRTRSHFAQYWTRGLRGGPAWMPALLATKHWLGTPSMLSVARLTSLYSSAPAQASWCQPSSSNSQRVWCSAPPMLCPLVCHGSGARDGSREAVLRLLADVHQNWCPALSELAACEGLQRRVCHCTSPNPGK